MCYHGQAMACREELKLAVNGMRRTCGGAGSVWTVRRKCMVVIAINLILPRRGSFGSELRTLQLPLHTSRERQHGGLWVRALLNGATV